MIKISRIPRITGVVSSSFGIRIKLEMLVPSLVSLLVAHVISKRVDAVYFQEMYVSSQFLVLQFTTKVQLFICFFTE